jgi:hypothetical protein
MAKGTRMRLACVGLTVAFGLGTTAHAQIGSSITPPSVTRTITVGQTITINKSITLGSAGATTVDLFFLADNTGSMGSIINNAKAGAGAILGALPNTYQFGVGRYVGDPVEGVAPNVAYQQIAPLSTDKVATQTAINSWFASGGGDFPEGNFFALQQVANTAGWRPSAQRLVVWFGDAPAHTETTTQAQAIAALQAANAKVVAFNRIGAGAGIDQGGQASAVVAGAGGSLTNNFGSITTAQFVSAVTSLIGAATSTIDLVFGHSLAGTGLSLGFTCTDPLGCTGVGAGQTRTFDLSITGVTPGTYNFNVFAQGVSAQEIDNITVLGPTSSVPEPSTYVLLATGLLAIAGVARRRRA